MLVSSSFRESAYIFAHGGTLMGSSNKPSELSSKPSSSLEHSMPFDSMPRILAFLILNGFASGDSMILAPKFSKRDFYTCANIWPRHKQLETTLLHRTGRTQTELIGIRDAVRPIQPDQRLCHCNGAQQALTPSTSRPAMVSSSISCCVSSSGLTHSRSHCSLNIMQ